MRDAKINDIFEGTQQVNLFPGATVDGVFSIWYGKGPGVDRSMDVLKAAGEAGLIVLVAGADVVRIAPSLVISLDEILEGLARLETALGRVLV